MTDFKHEKQVEYSVALQRAIETHCKGMRAEETKCPHHAKMLNAQPERAIWLKRDGNNTVVCVEAGGQWVEVIREPFDCPCSHIVEPSGIARAIKEAATDASEQDLRDSGGIVDAP